MMVEGERETSFLIIGLVMSRLVGLDGNWTGFDWL